MRNVIKAAALSALALGALTGCGINGKWSLAQVDPTAGWRDVKYNSLALQKDGTFYAEAEGDVAKSTSGTYTFEDNTLTLCSHTGEVDAYDATLNGNELRLVRIWNGQKLKTTYERQPE